MPQSHPLHLVTLGDSLAYGTGDERHEGIARRVRNYLPDADTVNLGVNGAQTADVLARLDEKRVRDALSRADVVVLSIGANDLFRTRGAQDELLRAPLAVADRILSRIEEIVTRVHADAPHARILILGAYNPVPWHPQAVLIDQYLRLWDGALAARFEDDPYVSVVTTSDIVTPQRLSRLDHFHPGGDAYEAIARRIAGIVQEQSTDVRRAGLRPAVVGPPARRH